MSGVETSEQITPAELRLATRNHGMPLEALRWPVTPLGLHYLLVHYDIPLVDADAWRLELGGQVERPLSLTLDELRARPAVELTVTMECAGNGRATLDPRPFSQPWLVEAVGTAELTGVPLRVLLDAAGVDPNATEVIFTGADHGVERGVEQDYQRSLPLSEAYGAEVLVHGAVVRGSTILRTGARIDVGGHSLSFFREEYADHGRPYGGRSGGEIGYQRRQPPRPSTGQEPPGH